MGGSQETVKNAARFIVIAVGIYGCFFTWSILHERIIQHDYIIQGEPVRFSFSTVLSLVTSLITLVISAAAFPVLALIGKPVKWAPVRWFDIGVITTTSTISSSLSFIAASSLPYPLYLTVMMGKMIPTVIVGRFWHGAQYSMRKYLSVCTITTGVIVFTLLNNRRDTSSGTTVASNGFLVVLLVSAIMLMDGATNSGQDAVFRKSKNLHPMQFMFAVGVGNVVAFGLRLAVAELFGSDDVPMLAPEVAPALRVFYNSPAACWDVFLFGVLGGFGKIFLYLGLSLFGSLTILAIMTSRKIGSVFLSVLIHGHPINGVQWAALALVAFGVGNDTMESISKSKLKGKQA